MRSRLLKILDIYKTIPKQEKINMALMDLFTITLFITAYSYEEAFYIVAFGIALTVHFLYTKMCIKDAIQQIKEDQQTDHCDCEDCDREDEEENDRDCKYDDCDSCDGACCLKHYECEGCPHTTKE
jgi:hypothetical protein